MNRLAKRYTKQYYHSEVQTTEHRSRDTYSIAGYYPPKYQKWIGKIVRKKAYPITHEYILSRLRLSEVLELLSYPGVGPHAVKRLETLNQKEVKPDALTTSESG